MHFPYSIFYSFYYVLYIAGFEVEPQFLKGILHLAPGIVPGVAEIPQLLISGILNDFGRMNQGEGELMTRHGELLPEPCGYKVQLSGVVCASFKADIVNHIDGREDGESVVEHHI